MEGQAGTEVMVQPSAHGPDQLGRAKEHHREAEEAGRSGVLLLIEREGRERFIQISFAKK